MSSLTELCISKTEKISIVSLFAVTLSKKVKHMGADWKMALGLEW